MEFFVMLFLALVAGHFLLTAIGYIGILFSPDYDKTQSKGHPRPKK